MAFYVYQTSDGTLLSKNKVSYSGSLLPGTAEKEIVPESPQHTIWNPVTLTLDSDHSDRYLTPAQVYSRFTDTQRFEYHGSTLVERVKSALDTYSMLGRKIWLDHPAFDVVFLDDLVSATDIPSFTITDKAGIKA